MKPIDYFLIYEETDNPKMLHSIVRFGLDEEEMRGLSDQLHADNVGWGFNESVEVKDPLIMILFPRYFALINSQEPVYMEF